MFVYDILKGCEIMAVLTESELRKQLKNSNITEYTVTKDIIITPSARQYLIDKNIKLVVAEKNSESKKECEEISKTSLNDDKKILPRFITSDGGFFESKPEHMTQLYGNRLVPKNHSRIIFRGKLDSLQSKILETQILAEKLHEQDLCSDLEEVLSVVRKILRAEVLNEQLEKFMILGVSEDEIHKMSHNPKKYFNMEHFLPDYKMGEIVIALNSIRSYIREVEISAYNAFSTSEGEISRPDIIRYLNRLSSCLYVMMFKNMTEKRNKR